MVAMDTLIGIGGSKNGREGSGILPGRILIKTVGMVLIEMVVIEIEVEVTEIEDNRVTRSRSKRGLYRASTEPVLQRKSR